MYCVLNVMKWYILGKHFYNLYSTTLQTYLLNYSMEKNPSWEANWFTASQEIPRSLWYLKVHFRIHEWASPVPILSQLNPVHTPYDNSWRFALILSCHLCLDLPSGPFLSDFLTKTLYTHLPSPIRATTTLRNEDIINTYGHIIALEPACYSSLAMEHVGCV
jgi:hypothetical protein